MDTNNMEIEEENVPQASTSMCTDSTHPIYSLLDSISVRGSEPTANQVKVVIPDENIRKSYYGSFVVDTVDLVNATKSMPVGASLSVTVKSLRKMHPFLDFDLRDKKLNPDRKNPAEEIIANLKQLFKDDTNWVASIRNHPSSGIHIICTNRYIVNYKDFVQRVTESVSFDNVTWKLDVPNNITLPGCGKKCGDEFVYRTFDGKLENNVICILDECTELKFRKRRSDFEDNETKRKKNNDDSTSDFEKTSQECEDLLIELFELSKGHLFQQCTENNAFLYSQCLPRIENNPYYEAAEYFTSKFKLNPRCIRLATIVEYLQNFDSTLEFMESKISMKKTTQEYIKLNSKNRINLFYLFCLQYPVISNAGSLYLYQDNMWKLVDDNFLAFLILVIKNVLVPSNYFNLVNKDSVKLFFQMSIIESKFAMSSIRNITFTTTDNFIFCPSNKTYIKASILMPMSSESLYFSKDEIVSVPITIQDLNRILNNAVRVSEGDISFVELFEGVPECVGYALFVLLTFFNFDILRLKYFLHIFHSIMFGATKKILALTGVSADNGKTFVCKMLRQAFGDAANLFNYSELDKSVKKGDTSPDFVKSSNKKLTMLDEAGNLKIKSDMVKNLTGGGEASSRTLFKDTKPIACNTNFLFAANSFPDFDLNDRGILTRLELFDCVSNFVNIPVSIDEYFSSRSVKMGKFPNFPRLDLRKAALGLLSVLTNMEPFDEIEEMRHESFLMNLFSRHFKTNNTTNSIPEVNVEQLFNTLHHDTMYTDKGLYLKFKSKFFDNLVSGWYQRVELLNDNVF